MKSLTIILALIGGLQTARAQTGDEKELRKYPDRVLALAAYKQMQKQMNDLQMKIGAEQAYYNTAQENRLNYLSLIQFPSLQIVINETGEGIEHSMRFSQRAWDEYLLKQQLTKDVDSILNVLEAGRAQRREAETATTMAISNLGKLKTAVSEAEQALLPLTQKPSFRQNATQTADYLLKVAAEYDRLKKEKP